MLAVFSYALPFFFSPFSLILLQRLLGFTHNPVCLLYSTALFGYVLPHAYLCTTYTEITFWNPHPSSAFYFSLASRIVVK